MEDLKQLNTIITQAYKLVNKISEDNRFEELVEVNTELLNKISILEKELETKTKEFNDLKTKYDHDINVKNNEIKEKTEELKNLTKVSFVQSLNKQVNDKNLIIQQLENQIIKLRANQASENKFYAPVVTEPVFVNKESESVKISEPVEETKTSKKKGKKEETKYEEPIIDEIKTDPINEEKEPIEESKPSKKKSKKEEPKYEEPIIDEIKTDPINEEPDHQEEETKIQVNKKKSKKEKQPKPFDPEEFEDVNGYELLSYKKNYYLRDLETNELYNIVDNNPGEIVGLLNSNGKVKFN